MAAADDRLLLTHDVTTVTHYAYERVGAGRRMPGVVEVSRSRQSKQGRQGTTEPPIQLSMY
jgi:hypothetical protein